MRMAFYLCLFHADSRNGQCLKLHKNIIMKYFVLGMLFFSVLLNFSTTVVSYILVKVKIKNSIVCNDIFCLFFTFAYIVEES